MGCESAAALRVTKDFPYTFSSAVAWRQGLYSSPQVSSSVNSVNSEFHVLVLSPYLIRLAHFLDHV
jgi:hypothetical protein